MEYSIVSAHLFKLNAQSRSTFFYWFNFLITDWIWKASYFLHGIGLEWMHLLWGLRYQRSEVPFKVHEELFDGIKPRRILRIHQDTGTHTLDCFWHWWMSMDSRIVHQHDDVFVLCRLVSSKSLQTLIDEVLEQYWVSATFDHLHSEHFFLSNTCDECHSILMCTLWCFLL